MQYDFVQGSCGLGFMAVSMCNALAFLNARVEGPSHRCRTLNPEL